MAAAAERFVVIVDWTKVVDALRPPVPLEVMTFGLASTMRLLSDLGPVRRHDGATTPDGNVLVEFEGDTGDPARLSGALDAVPGVVGHGLFPPHLVTEVLVGRADGQVQLLGDVHGTVIPFVERECSIQRRHQKVVEETPSLAVSPDLRRAILFQPRKREKCAVRQRARILLDQLFGESRQRREFVAGYWFLVIRYWFFRT